MNPLLAPRALGRALVQPVTRLRRAKQSWLLAAIYRRHRHDTMVSPHTYRSNLIVAEQCRNLDGCVVECGVWRGGMIAGIAELLGPDRRYYLFDSFEGLPPAQEIDGPAAAEWQANVTGPWYYENCRAEQAFAEKAMRRAGARDFHCIRGWFQDTLPAFQPDRPIALLRLDADWYESTMLCLTSLAPHLAPRALVIIDDYDTWDGCSRAVHRFLADAQSPARIERAAGVVFIRGLGGPGPE